MFVYLAHPIDQRPAKLDNLFASHPLSTAVNQVWGLGASLGYGFFRPSTAYLLPAPPWDPELARGVDEANRAVLFDSDAVCAVLPPGVATLGVPAEVEFALFNNKPTVLVTTRLFAASSVQVQSWLRQGAQLLAVDELGRLEEADDVAFDALFTTKPRDEEPFEVCGPDNLLVSGEAANLRERAYPGDAGFDLALSHEVELHPGEYELAHTGVYVAVPEGWYGLITARSSTWNTNRCRVTQGVIDSGYRGELRVGLLNEGERTAVWNRGSRPAQLVLHPVYGGKLEVVDSLPEHDRGTNGFGSSGQ